ncbi:hypothetical protein FA09DRAFT_7846 [Tilletiopsis washingtonensis]|uniref:Uncharacterized protein n=1 Tax=Tilletiopsis washingtonensis TaxID=58919 RepID=A0A316ZHL8_9BASI|nr:hypothetical protein FA09DRAFT_7846 [Tilletiopsis washingtonensis]PWO01251.1 hypothetical protein FA09DRAFT_7846 [Tilletiopsis washingtonensis]
MTAEHPRGAAAAAAQAKKRAPVGQLLTEAANGSSSPLSSDASAAPGRRTTARQRKVPSRLLSPSPPPLRSWSGSYASKTKAAAATPTAPQAGRGSSATPTAPGSRSKASSSPRGLKSEQTAAEAAAAEEALGPGKRKRRPSTMTRPPSTITTAPAVSVSTPAPAPGAGATSNERSSSIVRIKVRPSKSVSPLPGSSDPAAPTSAGPSSKVRRVPSSASLRQPALPSLDEVADDSDGGIAASRALLLAEPDDDADDSDAAGPTPERLRAAPSVRSSALARFTRTLSGGAAIEPLDPPPLLSRSGEMRSDGRGHARSRTLDISMFASSSAASGSSIWGAPVMPRLGRMSLPAASVADDSDGDGDDEDDFHQAMLDGGDFDVADDFSDAGRPGWKKSPYATGTTSDEEDTPATTPRSPQSCAELPVELASKASAVEQAKTASPKEKTTQGAGKEAQDGAAAADSVFVHALPPSSRRPHTHAGSLTLSLPFDEADAPAAGDDLAVARGATPLVERKTSKVIESATPASVGASQPSLVGLNLSLQSDAGDDAGLLSPGHALLGLAAPPRNGMSSTHGSPFVHAAVLDRISSPAPLALPPSRANVAETGRESPRQRLSSAAAAATGGASEDALRPSRSTSRRDAESWLAEMRSISPHSSLSARLEEEEDEDVFGPPEAMCLSDLDRVWDRVERARGMTVEEPMRSSTPLRELHDVVDVETPGPSTSDNEVQDALQLHLTPSKDDEQLRSASKRAAPPTPSSTGARKTRKSAAAASPATPPRATRRSLAGGAAVTTSRSSEKTLRRSSGRRRSPSP